MVVPVAKLRSRLGETLGRVRFAGERLVLTTHGAPVAAVVPLDDLERLRQVDVVGIPAPVVEESVVLPLREAELWRALVNGRYRAPWWSIDTLGACPGERVRERWLASDGRVVDLRGEVSTVEPGRSITLAWTEAGCARATTVQLRVGHTTVAGTTELSVVEAGFGPLEGDRAREHHHQWAQLLDRLVRHLGGPSEGVARE